MANQAITEDAIRSLLVWTVVGLGGFILTLAGIVIRLALKAIKKADEDVQKEIEKAKIDYKEKIANAFELVGKDTGALIDHFKENKIHIEEIFKRVNEVEKKIVQICTDHKRNHP